VGYGTVGERYEREIDGWDREMGEKREAELTDVAAGSLYTWTRSCTVAGNAIDIDTGISGAGDGGTSFLLCGGRTCCGCPPLVYQVVRHSFILRLLQSPTNSTSQRLRQIQFVSLCRILQEYQRA